ncbi:MAG TPA: hypothetical protein VFR70_02695 [Flavobacterium sp.]|nr:hypothetical protein [Flavobacterium sp.]
MENNISGWQPEKTAMQKVVAFKFFPLVLLILNILFFFYILPADTAESYDIFFAILGGVIMMLLSFWTVSRLILERTWNRFSLLLNMLCISMLFVFGIFFLKRTGDFSSEMLKENGVATEGVIIGRTKIPGRRGGSIQSITVEFKTDKGAIAHAKIDVTEYQYETLTEGTRVPIKYSSEHTNIATLYATQNDYDEQAADSIKFQQYKAIYGEEKAKKLWKLKKAILNMSYRQLLLNI